MKRRGILALFWIMILYAVNFLTGCTPDSKEEELETTYEIPETLDIFIVSDAVHEYYQSEDRHEVYYTTMMTVGDFDGTTTDYGEKGFMYYDVFKDYTEETGTNLNIHWYEYSEEMEADLEKLSDEDLPDLILAANTSSADYYRLMEEGYFYDLTKLFEQNEMYTKGEYYNTILSAGELNQKQYIVPILFSVDTIMGSAEKWEEIGLHMEDVETHSEFMELLLYLQQQDKVDQLVSQFVATSPTYLPQILYCASGEEWIDRESWTVNLDEDQFRRMATFYEQYLAEQFSEMPVAGEKIPWAESKHVQMCMALGSESYLDEFLGDIGCFVEGGSSLQINLHTAGAQAWYYGSRYQDVEEEFELYAIPSIKGGTTAHVNYFGAVLPSSDYPEAAFYFLKYLMDSEIDPFFGLSVNKELTEKLLDYYVNTTYLMRHGLKITLEDGELPDSPRDYVIQPMKEETKEKLLAIIDDIESVTLPSWPVYFIIDTQMQKYAKGESTLEDAYQTAFTELELYAKNYQSNWKP